MGCVFHLKPVYFGYTKKISNTTTSYAAPPCQASDTACADAGIYSLKEENFKNTF